MNDFKKKLIELLDKLDGSKIEYLYYLACKLFGYASD